MSRLFAPRLSSLAPGLLALLALGLLVPRGQAGPLPPGPFPFGMPFPGEGTTVKMPSFTPGKLPPESDSDADKDTHLPTLPSFGKTDSGKLPADDHFDPSPIGPAPFFAVFAGFLPDMKPDVPKFDPYPPIVKPSFEKDPDPKVYPPAACPPGPPPGEPPCSLPPGNEHPGCGHGSGGGGDGGGSAAPEPSSAVLLGLGGLPLALLRGRARGWRAAQA